MMSNIRDFDRLVDQYAKIKYITQSNWAIFGLLEDFPHYTHNEPIVCEYGRYLESFNMKLLTMDFVLNSNATLQSRELVPLCLSVKLQPAVFPLSKKVFTNYQVRNAMHLTIGLS